MNKSLCIQLPAEKVKQIKLRLVEKELTLKEYLLSLINKDLKKEDE